MITNKHVFIWNSFCVSLFYSIEGEDFNRQLILDDVMSESLEVVNSVPDNVIENEASAIASLYGAKYL